MFQLLALFGLLLFSSVAGAAQGLTARISLIDPAQPKLKIEGTYGRGSLRWTFTNTYGRIMDLGNRIQNLRVSSDGKQIPLQRVGPGEFTTERAAVEFSYEVNISPPANPSDAAHISWLEEQHGYLMLADLLPDLPAGSIRLELSVPRNWHVASSATRSSQGWYDLPDKAGGVFFVGPDLKEKHKRIGSVLLTLITAGEWSFSKDAVIENAAKIIKEYSKQIGSPPGNSVAVMVVPFPNHGSQSWSAETRGSSVILLASSSPTAKLSTGQLSIVLCHELFHLWIPNSLALNGDYAWFYEGFTLYHALCAAVRLKLVDFQEYLDTLGRVYDSYRSSLEPPQSLLEASQRRWTSGGSRVYDQGMLVGFLYDLKLRKHKGQSLDVIYQKLLREFPLGSKSIDGNEAITKVLVEHSGDEAFVRRFLESPTPIELETFLPEYGISVVKSGSQKRLEVEDVINPEQREVLESLGYRHPNK